MRFQFEGLDEIVEINFNFKNSNFIQALDPDESVPVVIPEKFPKHHIMIFKELLEIMETKPELSEDEKYLGLSSIMTPLIKYFSFDEEFKNRFKNKSRGKKIYDVFLEVYNRNNYDFEYEYSGEEKIGCCESLEDVSIFIKKHIIKNNELFRCDYDSDEFKFYLDLDKKEINLKLDEHWGWTDLTAFINLDDNKDMTFREKTSILSFVYKKKYEDNRYYKRTIEFLIQESILEDFEIIKKHPETPYNFTLKIIWFS